MGIRQKDLTIWERLTLTVDTDVVETFYDGPHTPNQMRCYISIYL